MTELREKLNNIVEEKQTKIIPENLKVGVEAFGVHGTFTADADATAADIAKDKTAYVNGEKINGTLEPLDTSDATATAEDIVEGKTAYVDNRKISGTLTGEEKVANLDFSELEIVEILPIEARYLSKVTINKDENLTANNIRQGTNIFGIEGTMEGAWDSSQIRSCANMFSGNTTMTKAPLFNTENVTNMSYMFSACSALVEAPQYNTQNVTGMGYMFSACSALVEAPQLNTQNVTGMGYMFNNCQSLSKAPLFNTENVTNMTYMFNGCIALAKVAQYNTQNVTNMSYMFNACRALVEAPQLNTQKVTNMSYMFSACSALVEAPQLNTQKVTTMQGMFYSCSELVEVPVLNTKSISSTGMKNAFLECTSLSEQSLDNILAMCTNAVKITNASYKTLKYIGLTSDQATRCTTLSNYEAFTAAGWKTGY